MWITYSLEDRSLKSRGVVVNPEGLWSLRRWFESARDYHILIWYQKRTYILSGLLHRAVRSVASWGHFFNPGAIDARLRRCSGSVVRSIIPAFRAEDSGSNPGRSIIQYSLSHSYSMHGYCGLYPFLNQKAKSIKAMHFREITPKVKGRMNDHCL
jgi:hypothetical protein